MFMRVLFFPAYSEIEAKNINQLNKHIRKMHRLHFKKDFTPFYKLENGIAICLVCSANYNNMKDMHHHLKKKCGVEEKLKTSDPKITEGQMRSKGGKKEKDYTQFYKKEDDSTLTCLSCETVYYSLSGLHSHLNTTNCGFGDKFRSAAKPKNISGRGQKRSPEENKDPKITLTEGQTRSQCGKKEKYYTQFYRKEDDSTYTCLGCEAAYYSLSGLHSHLNVTKCGFGDKLRSATQTSYLELYKKEGDQWTCLGCETVYYSLSGLHSHLNTTNCGFGDKFRSAAKPKNISGRGQKRSPEENKDPKITLTEGQTRSQCGKKDKYYTQFYRKEDDSTYT